MRVLLFPLMVCCLISVSIAHNSYTGGYSGAPGTRTCASACHGGTGGTLTIFGFPATYQPGQTYRIVVKHSGGSGIVNFNATTRIGSTSNIAGSFVGVLNSALYTGTDGGVYASPRAIDSAIFQWTAPAKGTGPVAFYAAAFQGTTSSSNGQSRSTAITSTEIVTAINDGPSTPTEFLLGQNYPNPFNPATTIQIQIGSSEFVQVKVYSTLGEEVATLVNEQKAAGVYSVLWNTKGITSGVYLYQLRTARYVVTKKMLLLK
jgi:hypothetical protein